MIPLAVYDTLFIELAEQEGTFLATFDEKVLKAYPAIAKRPGELMHQLRPQERSETRVIMP